MILFLSVVNMQISHTWESAFYCGLFPRGVCVLNLVLKCSSVEVLGPFKHRTPNTRHWAVRALPLEEPMWFSWDTS